MTAKVTLIGQPQGLRIEKDIVTFKIITIGYANRPASNTATKGLTLLPVSRAERGWAARRKATNYVVQCAQRHDLRSKSNRGRAGERDKSELVIEASLALRCEAGNQVYGFMKISSSTCQDQPVSLTGWLGAGQLTLADLAW